MIIRDQPVIIDWGGGFRGGEGFTWFLEGTEGWTSRRQQSIEGGNCTAFAPYRVRPFEFAPTLCRVRPHTFRVRPHQVEFAP